MNMQAMTAIRPKCVIGCICHEQPKLYKSSSSNELLKITQKNQDGGTDINERAWYYLYITSISPQPTVPETATWMQRVNAKIIIIDPAVKGWGRWRQENRICSSRSYEGTIGMTKMQDLAKLEEILVWRGEDMASYRGYPGPDKAHAGRHKTGSQLATILTAWEILFRWQIEGGC